MNPRRFQPVSAAERRNADLFFADLMGSTEFREDWLGEDDEFADSDEEWGDRQCPSRDEVKETWQTLRELAKLIVADRKEIESNPLVIEVEMLKKLTDVLDMAREVPARVWREIWDELKAFAACDVKPLVARVKKSEKHANAVLRVLNGLTSILQGYVHDQIDAAFKSRLDAQKGFGKAVAKVLIHIIKKQIPVIQREIKADNFAAVATAFEDLKKELSGQGVSVTGVWDVLVALGKEIIGNAIEDAVKNSARWAAKKVAKTLLKSAAKAATVIFILEDIVLLLHALVTISNYKERMWAFNRVLLVFLARVRRCVPVRPRRKYTADLGWKTTIARADCKFVLRSFIPEKGGKAGEGEWKAIPVQGTFNGKTGDIVRIDVPPAEAGPGQRVLGFKVPPLADWPARNNSFVALDVTTYSAAGTLLKEASLFIGVCRA